MKLNPSLVAFGAFFLLLGPAAGGGGMALPAMQALVALAVTPWRRLRGFAAAHWRPLATGFAFLLWALAAIAWGGPSAAEQGLKLIGAALVGLGFVLGAAATREPRALGFILLAGVSGFIVLMIVEAASGMAINRAFQPDAVDWALARNPGKGISVLALIVFAAAALAAQRGRGGLALAAALLAGAGWLSTQFGQAANIAAVAVGLGAALMAAAAPRFGVAGLLGAGAIAIALAPALPWLLRWAPGEALPFSWQARLAIWDYTAQRIAERPLTGWGLDSARGFQEPIVVAGIEQPAIPLHPHHMPLQIWLELGAVGAALAALTLALAAWAWAARPRARGAAFAAAGAIGAGLVYAHVSYGVWQEWWIAAQFLAAMACVVAARGAAPKGAEEPAPPRPPA